MRPKPDPHKKFRKGPLALHGIWVHYYRVLKNITLSAEGRLIEAARTRARQQRTTLNTVFRDWLLRYTGRDTSADAYSRLMRQLKHVSSGKKFSRDELNER